VRAFFVENNQQQSLMNCSLVNHAACRKRDGAVSKFIHFRLKIFSVRNNDLCFHFILFYWLTEKLRKAVSSYAD
jgi:hypothetical protein